MTITRADVADLRKGDVVRVTGWYGVAVEGALSEGTKSLWLGQHVLVRDVDGSVGHWAKPDSTLTVVSRAPRPLYVNHPRTEPVPGDVVRNEEGHIRVCQPTPGGDLKWWGFGIGEFGDPDKWTYCSRALFPGLLTLLVDGESGDVVPR